MTHPDWTPETERAAYVAQAQALVDAVSEYEAAHPTGAPCFHDALVVMREQVQP